MNSMTGFGAASVPFCGASLRVEISGTNRKQLECVINLPRPWAVLESRVRELVAASVSRGRVNIFVAPEAASSEEKAILRLNHARLSALREYLTEITNVCDQPVHLTLDGLLRLGVLCDTVEDILPPDQVWTTALRPALGRALRAFLQMREREGHTLCADLLERVGSLRSLRDQMLRLAADVPAHYREMLLHRLKEQNLVPEEPDDRLVKELALFADKCDVSEEMTRLFSHLQQFENICRGSGAVGRSLDFLCQEIFRELNTTGAKAYSAPLAHAVVTAKTELEKIREQVQNVE